MKKRYKLISYVQGGEYFSSNTITTGGYNEYYFDYLKHAKTEGLSILSCFKDIKGNFINIYDNGKLILSTDNDTNYWKDYRK